MYNAIIKCSLFASILIKKIIVTFLSNIQCNCKYSRVRFFHFLVAEDCTSDKHHRRYQAMMFSTVILGALAMIQFSVYF